MISLLIALAVLLAGFLTYGRLTEKIFAPDDRKTPAVAETDARLIVVQKPYRGLFYPAAWSGVACEEV